MLEMSERLGSDSDESIIGLGYAVANGWWPLALVDARWSGVAPGARPVPIDAFPKLPGDALYRLREVPGLLVLSTTRPRQLAGAALRGDDLVGERHSRARGTAGIRVVRPLGGDEWQPCLLTAGHTFPGGVGTEVVRLPSGRLARVLQGLGGRSGAQRIGVVSAHRSPKLPGWDSDLADYDFAIVDLDEVWSGEWTAFSFLAHWDGAPPRFDVPQQVEVRGGVTGIVRDASVMGALLTTAHRWRDCWMLGPSDALRAGDSGSAVRILDEHEHLGMFVGLSEREEHSHFLYVQSLQRLAAECLDPLEVRIESNPYGRS